MYDLYFLAMIVIPMTACVPSAMLAVYVIVAYCGHNYHSEIVYLLSMRIKCVNNTLL